MLVLIFADRYQIRLVKQNIGGHQYRIIKITDAYTLFLFAGLIFELRHPLEFGHARDAVEQPSQLSMCRHVGLYEDRRNLRVNADREIDVGQFPGLGREHFRILRQSDGVEIDDAKETLVFPLQRDPIPQRAEIISQMNVAGWLSAAEDSFHLVSAYQKDFDRNRQYDTENHSENAGKHCQDEQDKAEPFQHLEAGFKALRQNALQDLATIEWRNRNKVKDS